ncbi:MAG TPA: hypothetical protein PLU63_01155 [Candidatus Woesebacteria bacterium]|nr:hypothetical protein [Candidatus Woesebacteria bacterium]
MKLTAGKFKKITSIPKTLLLIILITLPFGSFYFGYLYRQITHSSINQSSEKNIPIKKLIPTNTIVPTISEIFSSTLLDNLSYKYNEKEFTVEKKADKDIAGEKYSYLSFLPSKQVEPVLYIFDISNIDTSKYNLFLTLNQLEFFSESDYESELRQVNVNNKYYKFSKQAFGESYPESNECIGFGGISEHYFKVDKRLLFVIKIRHHRTNCGGETKNNDIPNEQTLESVLKIIESVKIN